MKLYIILYRILRIVMTIIRHLPSSRYKTGDYTHDHIIQIYELYDKINDIHEKIKNLTTWAEYIKFEGKNYGLPVIVNNIHKENDCLGNIIITGQVNIKECIKCSNGWTYHEGCGGIKNTYGCDKCHIVLSENIF